MASLRSNILVVMVAAAALWTVSVAGQSTCPDEDTPLVYPYWSTCFNPARYYGEEVYVIEGAGLALAPEWDESNSTYYVRLADEGAKYILTHFTREYRQYVKQSDNVVVVNLESGRILSWRAEGEDEYFLVEEESGINVAATLQFAAAPGSLPCPRIANARCQAYYLLDFGNSSRGLSPYEEDGVTYFTRGSDTLRFLLRRTSTTSPSVLATKSVLAAPA